MAKKNLIILLKKAKNKNEHNNSGAHARNRTVISEGSLASVT